VIVDLTVGGGGHAEPILKAVGPAGRLVGIDKDPAALAATARRLARYDEQLALVKTDFRKIRQTLRSLGIREVNGILMDLGVSSHQLDAGDRGFSYRHDAPLDMRMDPEEKLTAADVIRDYSQGELTTVIRKYGEERWASRIAAFIAERRETQPINTTFELVDVIKAAIPAGARRRGPHPARRTFQAFRIEVNEELRALKETLEEGITQLKRGGRIVVISYHSLEDRMVKTTFKEHSEETAVDTGARLMLLTKKPIRPAEEEAAANARAESAKLRAAEKL
ncbi:MAG: 16S rRNA (cytosine(1402)-N(4))-methyltransferase RsmH, partial [Actinomycetota bacterium]